MSQLKTSIIHKLLLGLLLLTQINANAGVVSAQDTGYLSWTIVDHDQSIWRSELSNLNQQLVSGNSLSRQIAFDSVNNKVYWLNADAFGSIRRSNLDGSQQQTLIQFYNENVRGLALDVAAGKMYWLGATSLNRADMDGSNILVLNNSLTGTRDLELDIANSHIYYRAGAIMRSDLDGSNAIEIIPESENSSFKDMELDLINGKIYYSDAVQANALRRADLDGQNSEILISNIGVSNIYISNSQLFYISTDNFKQIKVSDLDTSNEIVYLTNALAENIGSFIVDINLANVYIASSRQLINTDLSGGNAIGLMATIGPSTHDVAFNPNGKQLFVADQEVNNIVTTDFEGLHASVVNVDMTVFGKIRGLTFDAINNQIYWVDANNSPNGGIKKMDVDGSNFTQLVSGINKPHDITLDVTGGKMYWTENTGSGASFTASIRSANLDGTNPTDVMTGLSQGIRGIDFDSVNNRLYFTDHSSDLIQRIDTDGTNLAIVIASIDPHDIAIDNKTGKLYWTEETGANATLTGVIRSADLDGGNATDLFTGIVERLKDISVVYVCQTAQPLLSITPAIDSGFPGDTLTYDITLTNHNSPSCDDETFDLSHDIPLDFTATLTDSSITLASGASQMTSIAVTSDVVSPFVTQNTITVIATPQSNVLDNSADVIYTVIDPNFLLTVSTSGTGSGIITATGIDCGVDCDEIYDANTQVSLTATAAIGSSFVSWSGACSGSNETVQITMTEDLSCDAEFSLNSYTLDITIVGQGNVISTPTGIDCGVDCSEVAVFGSLFSLQSNPDQGYLFGSWSGDTDCLDAEVIMTEDLNCTATFIVDPDVIYINGFESN